jgi:ethanolamine utilization microcompartment shell protein EutS
MIDMAARTHATDVVKPLSAKRNSVGRIVATVGFTVAEAWALVVVLAHVRAGGMDRIALALALAGCVLAVVDAWQNVRAQRTTTADADTPADEH